MKEAEANKGGLSNLTRKIASLGNWGKWPQNIERDLTVLLQLPAAPLFLEIPVRSNINRKDVVMGKLPIIPPHALFHYLHVSGKFQRNDAAIREFWQHTTRYGWLQRGHPGATVNACPLGLYGDDCRYNKAGEKLVVINFNMLLQEAKSLDLSRFPLFLLRVSRMVPDYSLTRVYQLLMWSFNALASGVHPDVDFEGNPLPQTYAQLKGKPIAGGPAWLCELRGDWKWSREAFALSTHWGAREICHLCAAKCPAHPNVQQRFLRPRQHGKSFARAVIKIPGLG